MNQIEQVVKAQHRTYHELAVALLPTDPRMTDFKFWRCRTERDGMGFTDEQYAIMAHKLGVSVDKLKGQGDGNV